MRARLLALGLGTLVMSLPAANAMAHDGWWRAERPEYREYREVHGDRDGRWGDRDDRRRDWGYDRRDELRERYERDRARYYHELREGDWREAAELRERLRCDEEALYRGRW